MTAWRSFRGLFKKRRQPRDPASKAASDASRARVAGDRARDLSDWKAAAAHYASALALDPLNAAMLVQFGHVSKEAGRWTEAAQAYQTAASLAPNDPDPHLHLGHALKLVGDLEGAKDAYAKALKIDPSFVPARNELISLSARERIGTEVFGRGPTTRSLARLGNDIQQARAAFEEWITVSTYPPAAYDAFRRSFPVTPPPSLSLAASPSPILFVVDAEDVRPSSLRTTLTSLVDQCDANWNAVIRAPSSLHDHSIASLAVQDKRIRFVDQDTPLRELLDNSRLAQAIFTSSGVRLDPNALRWLRFAAEQTKADVVWCDHDHHTEHWRRGIVWQDPILQPCPDPYDIATTPCPPALVFANMTSISVETGTNGADLRRDLIQHAIAECQTAHLPRLLASVRLDDESAELPISKPQRPIVPEIEAPALRIFIIIPTRDESAMLEACVESLINRAARPKDLDILVLDNRSHETETRDLLSRLTEEGKISVRQMDEPFNWSRFNNIGALGSNHDIIVFANNDIEMLSQDWDDGLTQAFSDPNIGLIGARLLYPNSTIQHAGVLLGGGEGRPGHEGVGASIHSPGPLGRWIRPHLASAVTGAFMAVRGAVFTQIGGFDERLSIAYNDIDFCLRVRSLGHQVLYDPRIELIHYESLTRGTNVDAEKIRWDDSELLDLRRRWGDSLFVDPSINPHWMMRGAPPYDGFHDLSTSQILLHLELSARVNPWATHLPQIDPALDQIG